MIGSQCFKGISSSFGISSSSSSFEVLLNCLRHLPRLGSVLFVACLTPENEDRLGEVGSEKDDPKK